MEIFTHTYIDERRDVSENSELKAYRSFKVIASVTNPQHEFSFLLIVISNLDHILYRCRDIATKTPEIAVLLAAVSFKGRARTDPWELSITKN